MLDAPELKALPEDNIQNEIIFAEVIEELPAKTHYRLIANLRLISAFWKKQVDEAAQLKINTYFPYLKNAQTQRFNINPLYLFMQESARYLRTFQGTRQHPFNVDKPFWELIIDALRGNFIKITPANITEDKKQMLYAIAFAQGYPFPENISDEYKKAIRKHAYSIFISFTGNLQALKILMEEDKKEFPCYTFARNGHLDGFKQSGPYPNQILTELIEQAFYGNQAHVAEYLFALYRERENQLSWKEKIRFMFWDGLIGSSEHSVRTELKCDIWPPSIKHLEEAASYGHFELVKIFVESKHHLRKVEHKNIVRALNYALLSKRQEIKNYLFEKLDLTPRITWGMGEFFHPIPELYLYNNAKKEDPKLAQILEKVVHKKYTRFQRFKTVILAALGGIVTGCVWSWSFAATTTANLFVTLAARLFIKQRAYQEYEMKSQEDITQLDPALREAFEQGVKSAEKWNHWPCIEQFKSAIPVICPAACLHWKAYYAGQQACELENRALVFSVSPDLKSKILL